jgi:tetratricopeptide (TPR) repeat protein
VLETIREYADELLSTSEDAREMRRRHAAHYLRVATDADQPIRDGPDLVVLDRMRLEQDNCRAALEFLLSVEDAAGALRLVHALGYFWYVTGQLREASAWFERALALPDEGPPVARARALNSAAGISMHSGDAAAARTYTEQALVVWREVGDNDAIVRSLNELNNAAVRENRLDEALAYLEEALELAKTVADPLWVDLLRANMGEVKLFDGRIGEARELYGAALAGARRHEFGTAIGASLLGLATVELADEELSEAKQSLREAISLGEELGYMDLMGGCLDVAAGLAAAAGDAERAAWFLGAAGAVDAAAGSSRRLTPVVEQLVATARKGLGEARFEETRQDADSATAAMAVAAILDYLD